MGRASIAGRLFWQRLRWVEIPMAPLVIFGGIRTAVVMNIGVMAIAAVIGAPAVWGLPTANGISGKAIFSHTIRRRADDSSTGNCADWLLHRLQVVNSTPKGIR